MVNSSKPFVEGMKAMTKASQGKQLSSIEFTQPRALQMGDSTLQTLPSETKINILNPNLNVKMFNKGVQTYLENTFSVPFAPNKKML